MTLDIPAKERSRLHLFALNVTPDDPPEDGPDRRPAALLGLPNLDPDYAEIVEIAALGDMSLSDYLAEGYDVTDLSPARSRLNALEGHALVILSLAFRDDAVTLTEGPNLTYIASFDTTGPDWSSAAPITSESAKPHSAPAETVRKRPSDAAMMGRVATIVLLVLFALTALMIWVA